MIEELARIKSTFLGTEDHGIFSFCVYLEYEGGSGQGFGHYDLRNPDSWQLLKAVTLAAGVLSWEDLPGQMVYALKDEERGLIRGLKPGPFAKGRAFRINKETGLPEGVT